MDKSSPERVIKAARSYVGKPFRHHFKPSDLCQRGAVTVDECMQSGLDITGFDCSGLVIASICKAVGADTSRWNREYRHLDQLRELIEFREPIPGDAAVLRYYDHLGVAAYDHTLVHASGFTKQVEIDYLSDDFAACGAIPLLTLIELAS